LWIVNKELNSHLCKENKTGLQLSMLQTGLKPLNNFSIQFIPKKDYFSQRVPLD